ncbi:SDR family oxidoreductase [Noviherbaspirillum sp. 1P10PC]|uniref:SDR family oxidoreductase n=1 Tax=Noviherbaspirillum sp. 1P10PC TaxID=3132292 RepID=UPI00399F73FF
MRYFVTGGTGFIGRRLIRKLLASQDNTVWFLIRESSQTKLPALRDFWGAAQARAMPVFGDICAGNCAVSDADRRMLEGKVDHFFHLAAIYDLRADPAQELATNIEGTRHALDLAGALRAGCFHHVSSIAAAGLYDGVFREDMFEEAENYGHPYFRSKHDSEKLVRTDCAVPWRIYRPGLVVGDSRTGETDKIDGPYYFFKLIQRLRAVLPPWMPAIGIEGGRLNIVPVDYVVDAMAWIAAAPGQDGRCFHLTDPAPKRVGDVLNLFAHAAHAPAMSLRINAALLDLVPHAVRRGLAALGPVRRLVDAVMNDLGLPDSIMQFINYPTRFDDRQAAAVLKGSGIVCPPLDSYAAAIWDYWERHLDPELFINRSLRAHVDGKVALVTGGSSGIGLATAQKLAEAGAVTLICGRDPSRLAAAGALIEAGGGIVHCYQANLADMADCDRFIARVLADHGHVDILVNNAGRSIRRSVEATFGRFHDYERTMQLNYFGALRMTMGLLPAMVARQSGQVINISSIGVLTNAPRFSAYVASKAALDAWTLCAAAEFADVGVDFTIINMPLVRTPMIAPSRVYDEVQALTPADAADLVVQAIVRRPVRIATRVGIAGQTLHALTPRLAQTALNTAYRLSPDSGAAEAQEGQQPAHAPSAELLAMQQLLHGIHI